MPTLQEYQTQDDAAMTQMAAARAAQQTQEAQSRDQQPSFLSQFMTDTGRVTTNMLDWAVSASDKINNFRDRAAHDVGAGIITGATNIADAAGSAISSSAKGLAAAEDPAHAQDAAEGSLPTSPIWDHAKGAIMDFRDAVAVKDPTLADNLMQAGAQLAVPFAGYSRAMAGLHGFANLVGAGAVTDATALGPHDPRTADLISLGRKTEGKFGDALRALTPDGTAQNAYINYLADRDNESEAEGRFKNVLDGFGANMVVTPLFHAVASGLKWGTTGLQHAIENGVGSAGDLMPVNQAGKIGWQQPVDMSLSPEQRALERERVAAERDRAEGVTQEVQPEPIPANAAAREGAAAQRDRGNQPLDSLLDTAASPLEDDKALSFARTHAQIAVDAGREGSVHDVVTALSRHMDTSTEEGSFYKGLFDRLSEKGLDTKLVMPGTGLHPSQDSVPRGQAGNHNTIEGTISLYKRAYKDNDSFVHTLAHESVHAATVEAIDKQPEVRTALSGLMNEAITSSDSLATKDRYGFKNPKEFVAEAESNPRFQQLLKNTKSADGRPLWDHYKEVVGGIFGLAGAAVTHPLWEQVLTGKKEKKDASAS